MPPASTFAKLNSIIEHDKAVASYKYVLLKTVIETCQEYPQYAEHEDGKVTLPIGLSVIKWILFYYPFFTPGPKIAVVNGEHGTKVQAEFREPLENTAKYYEQRGGISVFYDDLITGTAPKEIQPQISKLINACRTTIITKPMKYLGSSASTVKSVNTSRTLYTNDKKEYTLITYNNDAKANTRCTQIKEIIKTSGTYTITEELYSVFRELGGFVLGTGCINEKLTEYLIKRNEDTVSKEEILRRMKTKPITERDIKEAFSYYHSLAKKGELKELWTGQNITEDELAVDHMIPFAVWKSNGLWNLVPADKSVNSKKRDFIPEAELLKTKKDEIIQIWHELHSKFPEKFEREICLGLLGTAELTDNWEEAAFERLCETSEYLIKIRGYIGWKG